MVHQSKMLKEGVDIAICTPSRLRQLRQAGHLSMKRCEVCLHTSLCMRTPLDEAL
jgi:superfamily II DNA/RNA helicase